MTATDALLRATLRRQLSAYFPVTELSGAFVASPGPLLPTSFGLVDATVRSLSAAVLEGSGSPASAEGLRALPAISDRAGALSAMMAIEKVAHRTQGPGTFFRAIGGVPSTLVLVVDAERSGAEERIARAAGQLSGAIVRVVSMGQQLGAATSTLLDPLRAVLEQPTG